MDFLIGQRVHPQEGEMPGSHLRLLGRAFGRSDITHARRVVPQAAETVRAGFRVPGSVTAPERLDDFNVLRLGGEGLCLYEERHVLTLVVFVIVVNVAAFDGEHVKRRVAGEALFDVGIEARKRPLFARNRNSLHRLGNRVGSAVHVYIRGYAHSLLLCRMCRFPNVDILFYTKKIK